MTLVRIVYWNKGIKTKDIDHTEWVKKAPNTIQKLFIKHEDGWIEISGFNAYIIRDIGGELHFASLGNSKLRSLSGNVIDTNLESLIKPRPDVKFGVTIDDKEWKRLNTIAFI